MTADFLDAHRRHLRDADALFGALRLANADHLYGVAAECGLKRLMIAFGMETDNTGAPKSRRDLIHAEKVWARYEAYRSGYVQGVQYGFSSGNPFSDWCTSQRYAPEKSFDPVRVTPHRLAAHTVGDYVKNAERDGLL